jgi:hypothetical protein
MILQRHEFTKDETFLLKQLAIVPSWVFKHILSLPDEGSDGIAFMFAVSIEAAERMIEKVRETGKNTWLLDAADLNNLNPRYIKQWQAAIADGVIREAHVRTYSTGSRQFWAIKRALK